VLVKKHFKLNQKTDFFLKKTFFFFSFKTVFFFSKQLAQWRTNVSNGGTPYMKNHPDDNMLPG